MRRSARVKAIQKQDADEGEKESDAAAESKATRTRKRAIEKKSSATTTKRANHKKAKQEKGKEPMRQDEDKDKEKGKSKSKSKRKRRESDKEGSHSEQRDKDEDDDKAPKPEVKEKKHKAAAVSWSNGLPAQLYFKIFGLLDPASLINCTTVCKYWSEMFRNPKCIDWNQKLELFSGLKNEGNNAIDEKFITPRQIIGMVTGRKCQLCGRLAIRKVYWKFRARVCATCFKDYTMSECAIRQSEYSKLPYKDLPSITKDMWNPNARGWNDKYLQKLVYWVPQLKDLMEEADSDHVDWYRSRNGLATVRHFASRLEDGIRKVKEAKKNKISEKFREKKAILAAKRAKVKEDLIARLRKTEKRKGKEKGEQYEERVLVLCKSFHNRTVTWPEPLNNRSYATVLKKIEGEYTAAKIARAEMDVIESREKEEERLRERESYLRRWFRFNSPISLEAVLSHPASAKVFKDTVCDKGDMTTEVCNRCHDGILAVNDDMCLLWRLLKEELYFKTVEDVGARLGRPVSSSIVRDDAAMKELVEEIVRKKRLAAESIQQRENMSFVRRRMESDVLLFSILSSLSPSAQTPVLSFIPEELVKGDHVVSVSDYVEFYEKLVAELTAAGKIDSERLLLLRLHKSGLFVTSMEMLHELISDAQCESILKDDKEYEALLPVIERKYSEQGYVTRQWCDSKCEGVFCLHKFIESSSSTADTSTSRHRHRHRAHPSHAHRRFFDSYDAVRNHCALIHDGVVWYYENYGNQYR